MVAKKDPSLKSHEFLDEVPNLHVMKLMQSLNSRGYVRETFNWQWFYWYLTDEGLEYLREYLHLPSDIVPKTHKKSNVLRTRGGGPGQGGYNQGGDQGKDIGPGHDYKPNFADTDKSGGFGRGAGGF